jgi:hypothetical protein
MMGVATTAKTGSGFIIPANYTGRFRKVAVKRSDMTNVKL